jgi:hypothetical protein
LLDPKVIDALLAFISRPQSDPMQLLAGVMGPMGAPAGHNQGMFGEHASLMETPDLLKYEPFNPKFDWNGFVKHLSSMDGGSPAAAGVARTGGGSSSVMGRLRL